MCQASFPRNISFSLNDVREAPAATNKRSHLMLQQASVEYLSIGELLAGRHNLLIKNSYFSEQKDNMIVKLWPEKDNLK